MVGLLAAEMQYGKPGRRAWLGLWCLRDPGPFHWRLDMDRRARSGSSVEKQKLRRVRRFYRFPAFDNDNQTPLASDWRACHLLPFEGCQY